MVRKCKFAKYIISRPRDATYTPKWYKRRFRRCSFQPLSSENQRTLESWSDPSSKMEQIGTQFEKILKSRSKMCWLFKKGEWCGRDPIVWIGWSVEAQGRSRNWKQTGSSRETAGRSWFGPMMALSAVSQVNSVDIILLLKLWADFNESKVESSYMEDFDENGVSVVSIRGR